ncbi:hypothetical protein BH10PLA2_BH10PLA2_20260 [soil metagenome]
MRPFSRYPVAATLLASLLITPVALACLWDYDTLKMERARFPTALELITGKFLRHSPEFYQWRIQNRLERLKSEPTNVALLDDLSVAYDKTGQQEKAINTALDIEKIQPGRYETAANLGTFYIHAGRPKEGLPHIDRALQINPAAHFDREKYQKLFVEYVMQQRKEDPKRLPLADVMVPPEAYPDNKDGYYISLNNTFNDFLRNGRPHRLLDGEARAAVKGVLGIMKFGNYDSPLLLEALGSLLILEGSDPLADAKFIAARAFLKASYETTDEAARQNYRWMGRSAIRTKVLPDRSKQITLEAVEASFRKELEDANAWYGDLREREMSWIRDGKNPEAEFDLLYLTEPSLEGTEVQGGPTVEERLKKWSIIVGVAASMLLALMGAAIFLRRCLRARQLAKNSAS